MSADYVVEFEPEPPVAPELPPTAGRPVGTIIKLTSGPHAVKRFELRDRQFDGRDWHPING